MSRLEQKFTVIQKIKQKSLHNAQNVQKSNNYIKKDYEQPQLSQKYIKKRIGQYHIVNQIIHNSYNKPFNSTQRYCDYICKKQVLKPSDRQMVAQNYQQNQQDYEQKQYLLCRIQKGDILTNYLHHDIEEILQLMKFKATPNHVKGFQNLLLPAFKDQVQTVSQKEQFYLPLHAPLLQLFQQMQLLPLSRLDTLTKIKSQLFCLTLFSRFLLNIVKPLIEMIYNLDSQQQHQNFQIIQKLLIKQILIRQNILYEEKTNQFYLLFITHRFRYNNDLGQSPLEQLMSINKHQNQNTEYSAINLQKCILSHISQLFWEVFCYKSKEKLSMHNNQTILTTFLKNLLFVMWQGQLNFKQSMQILESKQKRKLFVNEKIKSLSKKQHQSKILSQKDNDLQLYSKLHIKLDKKLQSKLDSIQYQNKCNDNKYVTFRVSHQSLKYQGIPSILKSVKRKLTDKRNTINAFSQNKHSYFPPSNHVPRERKSRLFRHQDPTCFKGKSRSLRSSYQGSYSNTIAHCSNASPPLPRGRYHPMEWQLQYQQKNNHHQGFTSNKFNTINNVSRTVDVGNYCIDGGVLEEQHTANVYKKFSHNQRKGNRNDESLGEMGDFDKVTSRNKIGYSDTIQCNESKFLRPQAKKSPVKQSAFMAVENNLNSSAHFSYMLTKTKIRRYLQFQNIKLKRQNLSISKLRQTKKFLNDQYSQSGQKQLLSRSQQKALALFNRQFGPKKDISNNKPSLEQEYSIYQQSIPHRYATIDIGQLGQKREQVTISNQKLKSLLRSINVQGQYINVQGQYASGNRYDYDQERGLREYSNRSREFLINGFQPPRKNTNNWMSLNLQQNPKMNTISQNQNKIDDRLFRTKFYSHLEERKYFPGRNKGQNTRNETNMKGHALQVDKEAELNYHKINETMEKIQNQYKLQNEDVDNEQNEQNISNTTSKIIERKQKTFSNAINKFVRKVTNRNIDIEQVFAEQQMASQKQEQRKTQPNNNRNIQIPASQIQSSQQQRYKPNTQKSNQSQQKTIQHKATYPHQKPLSSLQSQQQQILQQLTGLISPIKQNRGLNKDSFQQKMAIFSNRQFKITQQMDKQQRKGDDEMLGQTDKQLQLTFNPGGSKRFQDSINQPSVNMVKGNQQAKDQLHKLDDPNQITGKLQWPWKNAKQDLGILRKGSFDQIIEQAKTVQRNPPIDPHKNSSSDKQKKAKSTDQVQQKINQTKKIKQTKGSERVGTQKKQQYLQQQQLQQIVLPGKSANDQKSKDIGTAASKAQQQKYMPIQAQPQKKNSFPVASFVESQQQPLKPPLPNNQSAHQKQIYSLTQKQTEQPASYQNPSVKMQPQQRQHTGQSSGASSYGPEKSVKKIVQQYIFAVNKIGQAVAKTPKVSKKLQGVVQWYVGVFFLYKRFLFQRKKIQTYLKQGTANKLTRYKNLQINKDDWLTYLKSPQRQALITKVTQQNVNISQSIIKMQKKLMARNIPQTIKTHAGISTRSNMQSTIAIEAIIDEFDILVARNLLVKDEEILVHCTEMLNACLVMAELDRLVQDVIPVSELNRNRRTPEDLEAIAQDLHDLYLDQ